MEILFTIDESGNILVEARGAVNGECLKWTEPFEKAFGGEIVERKMKPEIQVARIGDYDYNYNLCG